MVSLAIIGHCTTPPEALLAARARADWRWLVAQPGDFALAFNDGVEETLVSSLYAVLPYFLGPDGRHGASVAALSRGGIDHEALATLIAFSHTVGSQSLRSDVMRLPARSVATWRNGGWDIRSLAWEDFHAGEPAGPQDALNAFRQSLQRVAGESPVVSLTGGFDSRLILAGLLAAGTKPRLLSMGAEHSADVIAARSLAEITGLPLSLRPLQAPDYLFAAPEIATLTDGQKTADHWHSFFYAQGNDFPPQAHLLIGANGEFARSYYFDRGLLTLATRAAEIAPGLAKEGFWRAKLSRHRFTPQQIALLPPDLRRQFGREAVRARAKYLASLSPGGLLDGLDRFYLEQRVRHFIGYGMRLVGHGMQWRSPFLDQDWISAIAGLQRHWKMASNWHRYALHALAPNLMQIPESGYAGPMRRYGRPWRGLLWPKADKGRPYADYRNWFATGNFASAIEDRRGALAPVFGEALPAAISAECRAGTARPDAVGLLLSLGHWLDQ